MALSTDRGGNFDAIVVGSGPGGATVARELSKRRRKVLILERGDNTPVRESLLGTASIVNAVSVGDNLAMGRAFTTGGTTAIYLGAAVPPSVEAFLSLGIDLSRELEEAQRELPFALLPDDLLPPQSIRLRESAMALGYAWPKSPMLIDQSKCGGGYAPDAKWTARSYVEDAVANGATLINRARVLKIVVDANKRAVGVEYELRDARREPSICQARGEKIVLCAGGAASPIILRNSGLSKICNKGFYCHPNFIMFGTASRFKGRGGFGGSMGTVLDGDIHIGDGNLAPTLYRLVMLGNRRFIRAFLHSRSIGVGVMVKEGLGGGLRENGRFHKQLTDENLRKLQKGAEIAERIIQHAGGKNIVQTALSAAHLGGAIAIGEHVDENLETEYTNLHVCDGSVLPETINTPTFALICLGKYLANRLN